MDEQLVQAALTVFDGTSSQQQRLAAQEVSGLPQVIEE